MFVVQVRSQPLSGAPEACSTQEGSGPTRKSKTSLERLTKDKHSYNLTSLSLYLTLGPCTRYLLSQNVRHYRSRPPQSAGKARSLPFVYSPLEPTFGKPKPKGHLQKNTSNLVAKKTFLRWLDLNPQSHDQQSSALPLCYHCCLHSKRVS